MGRSERLSVEILINRSGLHHTHAVTGSHASRRRRKRGSVLTAVRRAWIRTPLEEQYRKCANIYKYLLLNKYCSSSY